MSDPTREEEIFSGAVALPAAERSAFLTEACGGDSPLRASVESLLAAHDRAASILDDSPVSRPEVPEENPGDRIGRYKLLQKIGEGGYGVVYMAEQTEPVRRRVAVKVIKLGMDTKAVIARFEAERQALALMDHPNIAKVFDGGATDNGRPYFVMELVRGISLTRYCDDNQLTTPQRIGLFTQVCHAIQHAHQKGVIHRDIKPSNILVALHDTEAVPKVIDFGIAKATQGRLTDQSVFTAFEQFIGTPAYTSPEQANLSDLDIDTRSDVYSLGVLLYELLTGRTPFDGKALAKAGLDEIRRHIREVDPPRPSTRLTTLESFDLGTVARQRQTAPLKLINLLRGDLDWIVMRCLEKDRRRRYETASDLARDLERHLNDETVTARPPTTAYRLRKTVQRHKLAVATTSVVALALIAGLGTATWAFVQEKAAHEQAQAAEQRAIAEAKKSEEVARFLETMLEGVGPSVALGRDTTLLREIADQTADRLEKDLRGQPAVEAKLRETLGGVYFELGEFEKAKAMHDVALHLLRHSSGANDLSVARALRNVALSRNALGETREAERMLREAIAIQQKRLGQENLETAATMTDLASVLFTKGDTRSAEAHQRAAVAVHHKLRSQERFTLARSLTDLALSVSARGDLAAAEETARTALAMQRRIRGPEHPETARAHFALSSVLYWRADFEQAESHIREALAIQRKVMGNAHPVTAESVQALGCVLTMQFDYYQGEIAFKEALEINRMVFGQKHPKVARSLYFLAWISLKKLDRVSAKAMALEALSIQRTIFDEEHLDVADTLGELAIAQMYLGEIFEAEDACRKSLSIRRRLNDPNIIHGLNGAIVLLSFLGKRDEALALAQEKLGRLRALLGTEDRITLQTTAELAFINYEMGNYECALQLASGAYEALQAKVEPSEPDLYWARDTLGLIHQAAARTEDAIRLFDENFRRTERAWGATHIRTNWARYRLGGIYREVGRRADGYALVRRALEIGRDDPTLDPHVLHGTRFALGELLVLDKEYAEAEPHLRAAFTSMKSRGSEWQVFNVQSVLGTALTGQKKYVEAERILLEAHYGMMQREAQIPVPNRKRLKESADRLVFLYTETGRPNQAREWQAVADAIRLNPSRE